MIPFSNRQNSRNYEIIALFLFSLIFVWFSSGFFFFWDNIAQLSVPANYYYDSVFKTVYLPDEITTGHQPFVGMYLALGWMIFGRSIEISHWLMWPFVFGVLCQLLKFISYFVSDCKSRYIVLILCILESVFITQLSLITFEILHLFFFLATINAFLRYKKLLTILFFLALMMISLRAAMSGIGLVLFVVLRQIFISKQFKLSEYLTFIPGFLFFSLFLFSFYVERGWIIHNTVSQNWEQSSKFADLKGIFRNILIFIWRLADYGKIIFWLLFLYIIKISYKTKSLDHNFLLIILIAISQFIIFFCTTIPYQNSIGHRYLLPITIIFSVGIMYWILKYKSNCRFLITSTFIFIISGYFWIYPFRIAKGWDAMPMHWSYYSVWYNMRNYLSENKISTNDVKSFFPNTASFKNITLENNINKFGGSREENYVIFSNVYNESDEVLNELFYSGKYTEVHKEQRGIVYLVLLKKSKPFTKN